MTSGDDDKLSSINSFLLSNECYIGYKTKEYIPSYLAKDDIKQA
jgi:hypothetical protein